MAVNSVNGKMFKKMVTNGAINLKNNCEYINSLNVFPVPDGDTGINMSMTIESGVIEINKCESDSIIDLTKIFARGLLMGARGNSGVSLSQYFRGLSVAVKEMQKNTLNVDDLIYCLGQGKEIAYRAFKDPIEGTMLTVIRESYEAVKDKKFANVEALFEAYYEAAKVSEANTPNLLPVLKEANVTDSGGEGFLKVVEGMYKAIKGEIITEEVQDAQDENYVYSADFKLILKDESIQVSDVRDSLAIDATVDIEVDGQILSVHVGTDSIGDVLNNASKYGSLVQINIKNEELNDELPQVQNTERKEIALVTVAFGDGIKETFKELGCSVVINGGQTMNPSTESFVNACKEANADNIIIIPNNGNVIMAAEQASKMIEGCNVKVLRAKTIAQGYASLMSFDETSSIDDNIASMSEAISNVKTGEVTYAVRDTAINGVEIKANDFMGILDGDIIVSKADRIDSTKDLLKSAVDEESSVVTIFVGSNVLEDEVAQIEEYVSSLSDDVECQVVQGNQEIYSYIIAIE